MLPEFGFAPFSRFLKAMNTPDDLIGNGIRRVHEKKGRESTNETDQGIVEPSAQAGSGVGGAGCRKWVSFEEWMESGLNGKD
jgi:hypothetical protein